MMSARVDTVSVDRVDTVSVDRVDTVSVDRVFTVSVDRVFTVSVDRVPCDPPSLSQDVSLCFGTGTFGNSSANGRAISGYVLLLMRGL